MSGRDLHIFTRLWWGTFSTDPKLMGIVFCTSVLAEKSKTSSSSCLEETEMPFSHPCGVTDKAFNLYFSHTY